METISNLLRIAEIALKAAQRELVEYDVEHDTNLSERASNLKTDVTKLRRNRHIATADRELWTREVNNVSR